MEQQAQHVPGVAGPGSARPPALSSYRSEELLRGQREILIQHGETWYRLRHTSNGKLILTK